MSWIDIFLSDGDPHRVYGANAKDAISRMPRIRDLPWMWLAYRRAGLPIRERFVFLALDIVRNMSYRRGFSDGADFPWPEEPRQQ